MDGIIEQSIADFIFHIGSSGAFLIATVMGLIGFIVSVFLAIFKANYSLKKRLLLVVYLCAFLSFYGAIIVICRFSVGLFLMVVGEYVLFSAVVFNIPEKQSFLPEHIDLARLIDGRVKEEKQEENASDLIEVKQEKKVDTLKSSPIFNSENKLNNEKPTVDNNQLGLDFTHVKNVLKRLDYYSLNPTDKRQVRELETLMFKAENGEQNAEIKCELNDGLGALLKIMSKYGV